MFFTTSSGITFSPILIGNTPFGCNNFLTSNIRYLVIKIERMIFIPPVVDPADPPIKNKKNNNVFDISGQSLKFSVLKPVVVIIETAVKIECRKLDILF